MTRAKKFGGRVDRVDPVKTPYSCGADKSIHVKLTGVRYAEHSGPNVSGRGGCGMQRHAPTYVPIAARAE